MSTIGMVLTVILMILAVILAAIILMQSNSVEGALERYTKIGGALFMILALIINLVG